MRSHAPRVAAPVISRSQVAAARNAAAPVTRMPTHVRVREVGPRDGFQNESERITTPDKIRLINALARTGVKRLEVTSFVRKDVIPQLDDAVEVLHGIDIPDNVDLSVLVPNERGLEEALEHRETFHEVGIFVSASETHNRKNVNRTVDETMAALEQMLPRIHDAGLRCEAVIAVAFGCPYEGRMSTKRVLGLATRLAAGGAHEIAFGDTTGMANPRQVREFFEEARQRLPGIELTAHFHNTRGQGLANVLSALECGVDSFESSFGELGGCPVPKGATGNIASEDLISMLDEMQIDTGVSVNAVLDASRDAQTVLGRRLGSHVLTAGPVVWHGS